MSGVTTKVEVAFVANPYGTLTWTDISDQVAVLATTRGRQYELDQNQAGTLTATLRNVDGRFDPTNTASPYWPNVLPYRPIRVTATYSGTTYPLFYGFVERWPQKWPLGASARVELVACDASKAVLSYTPGDPYDVKVRKDYDVYTGMGGVGSSAWDFYPFDGAAPGFASENPANSGAQFTLAAGSGAVGKATPSPCRSALVFTGTQGLSSAAQNSGEGEVWLNPAALPTTAGQAAVVLMTNGKTAPGDVVVPDVHGAWNNTDVGAAVFLWMPPKNLIDNDNDASFETDVSGYTVTGSATISRDTTKHTDGAASMKVSATGTTWTVQGNGYSPAVAGRYYQFSFQQASVITGTAATITPTFDFYNSSHALISSINCFGAVAAPVGTNGFAAPATNSSPVQAPTGTTYLRVHFSTTTMASGQSVNFDALAVYEWTYSAAPCGSYYYPPSATPAAQLVVVMPSATAGATDTFWMAAPALNTWHMLAWASGLSVGAGKFVTLDGVAVPAGPAAAPTAAGGNGTVGAGYSTTSIVSPFSGQIAALYLASHAASVTDVTAALALQHYSYGLAPGGSARTSDFAAETTGARIGDVLTSIGWPAAMRSIATGASTMPASGNVAGTPALTLIQAAADAELGNVYVDASGNVVFKARADRNARTPTVTIGDGTGEMHYLADLELDFDDERIYNDVQITQTGATPAFRAAAADATSENTYGLRTLTRSVELANTADVTGMAATLLARYKNPHPRVPQATFDLQSNPGQAPTLLGLDIGVCVAVKRRPPGAPAISINCFVDGINDTVNADAGTFTRQLMLTPQYPDSTY